MGDESTVLKTLDMEVLKTQDGITEDQMDQIAQEAYAEVDGTAPQEEEEERKEPDQEEKGDEEGEAGSEETGEPGEGEPGEPGEEGQEKTEEELKADAEAKKMEDELKADVAELLKDGDISEDEARKILDGEQRIREKYGNDIKKLTRAYRNLQVLHTKLQKDSQDSQAQKGRTNWKEAPLKYFEDHLRSGKLVDDKGNKIELDDLTTAFRKEFQELTEYADDDQVIKMMAKDLRDRNIRAEEDSLKNVVGKANGLRKSFVESMTEADDKFKTEITDLLNRTGDHIIASEGYNFDDVLNWARGKYYHEDKKKAYEEGFKAGEQKGKESPEVVLDRGGVGSGKSKSGKTASKLGPSDERRMDEMFDGQDLTRDQKISMFLEIKDAEKKAKDKLSKGG